MKLQPTHLYALSPREKTNVPIGQFFIDNWRRKKVIAIDNNRNCCVLKRERLNRDNKTA